MAARFVLKDRKGGTVNLFGLDTSHFVVDLVGDESDLLRQVRTILKNIKTPEDAFVGTCIEIAKTAADAGEFPYQASISTLTIAWKRNE